eukprot:CAMPEP_0119306662 /NCGR_PEP_ID=MMETSP1333-20130426/7359_1 /TAXON_ID=418940 /ORGANISM="Scyphosphaera apsteinii, Strain RCC1455" /LENGTH=222 /DNA_ID=CAMNT_0007310019 /DNA_START=75 /DNA_END=743 /DNA_ORIENTATION=-
MNYSSGSLDVFDVKLVQLLFEKLHTSLGSNLIGCLMVCFAILTVSIGSVRLALLGIVTVIATVASLLGGLELAGYTLGEQELIGATLAIGLSFDYALHTCCSYRDSRGPSREDRARDAVATIGPTLFAAVVTTSGSVVFAYATDVLMLHRIAIMMISAVCLALGYSLLLLIPLCAIVGPVMHEQDDATTAFGHITGTLSELYSSAAQTSTLDSDAEQDPSTA